MVQQNDATGENKQLIDAICSRYIGERIAAERKIREMGADGVALLLDSLAVEEAKRKRRKTTLVTTIVAAAGVGTTVLVFMRNHQPVEMTGFTGLAALAALAPLAAPTQRQHNIMALLSQLDDARAVGPLLDVVSAQADRKNKIAICRALARSLRGRDATCRHC